MKQDPGNIEYSYKDFLLSDCKQTVEMLGCFYISVWYLDSLTILFYTAGGLLMDIHPEYKAYEFYLCGDGHTVELEITIAEMLQPAQNILPYY